MLPRFPDSFAANARRLMRRRGVVGVFWGAKRPGEGGRNCLRIQVREKLPCARLRPNQIFDKRMDGMPTCVVGVGQLCGQALTFKDLVNRVDDPVRVSTVTALVERDDGGWLGLLSGHGTLPMESGALDTSYEGDGDDRDVSLDDVASGIQVTGSLLEGRIASVADFAVAALEVPAGEIIRESPATGSYRPPIRTAKLARGERLHHYSTRDKIMREGTINGFGEARLTFGDGREYTFTEVIEVFGVGEAFSASRDSGSLVADAQQRAVGVIIGGSHKDTVPSRASYVLPFRSMNGDVNPSIQQFFS